MAGEAPFRPYGTYEPGVIVAQKFQLVRILGEGGMGSVWVAKNLALDVHVALKLIRAELSRSVPGLGERLLQEARAAASIEHPAVIKIFDFGLTELKDPYIAMELLNGESLAGTVQRRGKVNAVRAVQTLLPIADALLTAHERGIVHRDLKPDNIFLARGAGNRLEPKVLDFGIAKFEQKTPQNLTSIGTILGSPAYMSPEQARGESDVDGRTDVWALCVVLYEVITGHLPFVGDNYNALLYAILEGQPKTFTERGINEPLLWSIVLRGLEKDRARRCPDMFELGRALAIWLLDRGVQEDVCNALLKPKWLKRSELKSQAQCNSFFPSDPPLTDGQPHTLRSGEHEDEDEGAPEPMPFRPRNDSSSGVLLRPAGEPSTNLFGIPYSSKTGQTTVATRSEKPLSKLARARWLWLTVIGAVVSFSVAVGMQAWSGSARHDEDDPPPPPVVAERGRLRAPAETVVQSVVEMPHPVVVAEVAPPPSRHAPSVERASEPRPAATRPVRPREVKPPRSDLKNPFR
jgi:serine/threonine-protein kinase